MLRTVRQKGPTFRPGLFGDAACAAALSSTAGDAEEDDPSGIAAAFAPAFAIGEMPLLGRGRSHSVVNFSGFIPSHLIEPSGRDRRAGAEGDAPSHMRPTSEIFPYSAHGQTLAATQAALQAWLRMEDRPHEMSTLIHLARFPPGSIAVFRTRLRAQPSQALQSLRSLLELSTPRHRSPGLVGMKTGRRERSVRA